MLISRTPFRVSLFGGSTDYPSFYEKHGSVLVGFALNKYCYLAIRKTPNIFNYKTKLCYSKTEIVNAHKDIEHNGTRGCLQFLQYKHGIELTHNSDLPSQTGIGSSSSFVVGLLQCLHKMNGDIPDKHTLAKESIYIERKLLSEDGGIQDQIWAAYGGFNTIVINKNGDFTVTELDVSPYFVNDLIDRSVLIYTGRNRASFEIAKSHDTKSSTKLKRKIKDIAYLAHEACNNEDIDEVARLLHQSWLHKKSISSIISNDRVDALYSQLSEDGMIGGKLLGSGGAGFIFGILNDRVDKKKFKKKYKHNFVDFNIDYEGSKIIYE